MRKNKTEREKSTKTNKGSKQIKSEYSDRKGNKPKALRVGGGAERERKRKKEIEKKKEKEREGRKDERGGRVKLEESGRKKKEVEWGRNERKYS